MSNVVPYKSNNLPAEVRDVFNASAMEGDLSDGVSGGFAVVSIRGSRWRISHQGESTPVLNAEGEPAGSLEVVIVKGNPAVSKIFYADKYVEGDDSPPDCWSADGISPDPAAEQPQAKTCAACPHSVWGSKITEAGKKSKACADNRRLAVVPAGDVPNEVYGGPMLLRIPAASLGDLAKFGKGMNAKGHPYNAIITRLGFDLDMSYPKVTFKAVRPLNEEQLTAVAAHYAGGVLENVLNAAVEVSKAAEEPEPEPEVVAPEPQKPMAVDTDFESGEETSNADVRPRATKKKTTKKVTPRKATTAPKSAAAPSPLVAAEPPAAAAGTDDLDDILSSLNALD